MGRAASGLVHFASLRDPFSVISFNGTDLSRDERVGIYLEDHYYNRSDAAVVFQRHDHSTGDERYIYHGNDGTNMPWNDTAQLNFLKPEVREAVIQTILHVARQFPDAAVRCGHDPDAKRLSAPMVPEAGRRGGVSVACGAR